MNKSIIKDLSIQVSLSGLSFCILNRTSNIVEFLVNKSFDKNANPYEALEQLKKALGTHPELSSSFSSVVIIYQNELSNLVPKSFFDENQLADYLKFSSKILKSDFISHDEVAVNEAVNVYVPYMNINNFIFDTFGVFEYKHASTILIDTILQEKREHEGTVMYLNFNANHFELIAIKDKKLHLYNSFEYTTKEDVIYFLLFTIEQLNFDPETVKLKLMGLIEKDDDVYAMIYNYVRFVDFYKPNYNFEFSTESNPLQTYHNGIILNSF